MAVPLIDLRRRVSLLEADVLAAWKALLDQGIFIGGAPVEQFENAFARYCGAAHCVAVANGTDALELSLRAVGVEAGDEVITVANAGGYATAACHVIGAQPVYIDVEPSTCQLNPALIEEAISVKTRALVVTHLYGLMNDVEGLRHRLAALQRPDIAIVEDCAQAHGASRGNAMAGTLGDAAAFSFYPTKNLGAFGDAGAILCQDARIAERARELRQYGWKEKYRTLIPGGRNSRMDPIQAIVLALALKHLAEWNAKRRHICGVYASHLPTGWGLVYRDSEEFVGHLAVAIAPDVEAASAARDALRRGGIGYDVHYPILDSDQVGWRDAGRVAGSLAVSRALTQRITSLPCFAELTADELNQVLDALHTLS
jgi:dTDP-3-amino-2,3,6-trideoxy-4-keto-D-glucose/dTDP-3-amino-3,4,6-trideoxy-alpha-D-glucose/dTDP-2,6-dideoxy-D-kanosamine transaminase